MLEETDEHEMEKVSFLQFHCNFLAEIQYFRFSWKVEKFFQLHGNMSEKKRICFSYVAKRILFEKNEAHF